MLLSVSDAFPIGGYRRKPYLFIAGVLGFASWVLMWCAVDGVWSGFACMLMGSMAIAIAVSKGKSALCVVNGAGVFADGKQKCLFLVDAVWADALWKMH